MAGFISPGASLPDLHQQQPGAFLKVADLRDVTQPHQITREVNQRGREEGRHNCILPQSRE